MIYVNVFLVKNIFERSDYCLIKQATQQPKHLVLDCWVVFTVSKTVC